MNPFMRLTAHLNISMFCVFVPEHRENSGHLADGADLVADHLLTSWSCGTWKGSEVKQTLPIIIITTRTSPHPSAFMLLSGSLRQRRPVWLRLFNTFNFPVLRFKEEMCWSGKRDSEWCFDKHVLTGKWGWRMETRRFDMIGKLELIFSLYNNCLLLPPSAGCYLRLYSTVECECVTEAGSNLFINYIVITQTMMPFRITNTEQTVSSSEYLATCWRLASWC